MRRLVRLTAWVLGLTLLLSACGDHKTVETADVGVQTAPPAEGVTALTLCDGDVTLRFEKVENAAWVWQDDPQFPLEQTALEELLSLPTALEGGEVVPNAEDLSIYGLASPTKYITVTSDGADVTYYIGEQATDGRWYVLTPAGAVRFASDENKQLLSRSIYSMAVLPGLPALSEERVRKVTLTNDEGGTVSFRTGEDGTRRSGSRDVTAKTDALIKELCGLTLSSCVDYDPAEGAAEVCGLTAPEVTLEVEYTADNGSERVLTVYVGLPTGDGGRYVSIDDDSTIYRMEESSLAQVLTLAETGL